MGDCAWKHHHQSTLQWRSKKPRSHGRCRNRGRKRKREQSWEGCGQNKRLNRQSLAFPRLRNRREERAFGHFRAPPRVSPDSPKESAELPPALDRSCESGPCPAQRTFTSTFTDEEFFISGVECSEPTRYSDQTGVEIGVGESVHRDSPCCLSD